MTPELTPERLSDNFMVFSGKVARCPDCGSVEDQCDLHWAISERASDFFADFVLGEVDRTYENREHLFELFEQMRNAP
jgi:hypothetical protein